MEKFVGIVQKHVKRTSSFNKGIHVLQVRANIPDPGSVSDVGTAEFGRRSQTECQKQGGDRG